MRPFGLVLAGGRAQRMGGGNKPLLALGRGTLLSALLRRLRPQCAALAINAPDPADWQAFGLPILTDPVAGFVGPLAGVLAGLQYIRRTAASDWLLTVPGDTPFVPLDLVARLAVEQGRTGARIACATSGGRVHPVVALWSVAAVDILAETVGGPGNQSVLGFLKRAGFCQAEWPATPYDPFFNVNTPEHLIEAQRIASALDPT